MKDDEKEDDLIEYKYDKDSKEGQLIEKNVLPSDIAYVRTIVNEFDPKKLDKYSDALIYDAYYNARAIKNKSLLTLAKSLKISKKLLDYYMETYPKFLVAVNTGFADAQDTMVNNVIEKLYECAMGKEYLEETEEETESTNSLGKTYKSSSTVKHKCYLPPNYRAQLAILKRFDTGWDTGKANIEINTVNQTLNQTLNVAKDINVDVDYRNLSSEALKELLNSQKRAINSHAMKREEKGTITDINIEEDEENDDLLEKNQRSKNYSEIFEENKEELKKLKNRKENRLEKVKENNKNE